MKKSLFLLVGLPLTLLAVLAAPAKLLAVDIVGGACNGGAAGTAICEASNNNNGTIVGRNGIITKIVQTFAYIAGIVAVITMIIAGFKYITSNGDAGSIASAKNSATYSLVGVIIAAFAQTLVVFVLSKF